MTAQYWGKGDLLSLKKVITLMYRITLIAGTLFMIVTLIFPGEIMKYLYS